MLSDGHLKTVPRKPRTNRRRPGRTLGITMLFAGAILLSFIGAYYAYSVNARSQLEDLNFVVPQTAQAAPVEPVAPPAQNSNPPPIENTPAAAALAPDETAAVQTARASADKPNTENQQQFALTSAHYTALYPAMRIHPKFWTQPLWSGGEPYLYSAANLEDTLPEGFRPVSASTDALARGEGMLTKRITIPLIEVNSDTKELSIINLGDSKAYETPKNLVGHIPRSSNPGEIGNGWYFGHLESPIKGEGNVFQRLPEIPDLLRDGEDVFVELESTDGRAFLYKTTRTEVVHQDNLQLYESDVAQITLVACVPRLVYDHRIVVTAELVGIKDASSALN